MITTPLVSNGLSPLLSATALAHISFSIAAPFVNHVWQSTAVSGVAWMLALALRNNHARTRYWVWMIASIKFLVPFSLFVGAGEWLRSAVDARIPQHAVSAVVEQIAQPFPADAPIAFATGSTAAHTAGFLAPALFLVWVCGASAVAISWARKWLHMRSTMRAASPCQIAAEVPALCSTTLLEPGIFGVFRPVLMVPQGILSRLTAEQLDAIVTHEMCHVRRRDNLTFALHIIVETLFWFHPLVWFIRARLVEERELACDEAVLQSGSSAEVYAEGILNVCKFYVESPLACVSGVSGSDLKKRIFRIMTEQVARRLQLSRKLLLSAAAFAAIAFPVAAGLFHAAQIAVLAQAKDAPADLPHYEVATIKANKASDNRMGMRFNPDGVEMTGVPLDRMLHSAFNIEADRMIGEPGWAKTQRWDIQAKVSPEDAPKLDKLTRDERLMMLQSLLVERFGLKYHHETRELPLYVLVVAKGGLKMKASEASAAGSGNGQRHSTMFFGNRIEGNGSSIEDVAHMLSSQVGRTILNKTGLSGNYDYTLQWTPENMPPPGPGPGPSSSPSPGPGPGPGGNGPDAGAPDAGGPSLFTAIQEQLGLKLEAEKGPVDVIVIDHLDQPSAN